MQTLDADTLARIRSLELRARQTIEGFITGGHRSKQHGFAVEFAQHREYVPGDDIRHIDWKSYGRSERYTIKQYEQETNFVGHILLDASLSMDYGEGASNKLAFAKLLAATLAYVVVHQRDTAALNIFDNGWRGRVPASSQPGQVMTILRILKAAASATKAA